MPRSSRWGWVRRVELLALVAILLVPIYAGYAATGNATNGSLSPVELGFLDHIDHIVFVVLENHAYDNYFGRYCLQTSTACPQAADGIPAGTCVPYDPTRPSEGCIEPFNFTAANWTVGGALPHGWRESHASWDGGAMDGFYLAERSGLNPFGTYNGSTAPLYWDLAEEYGLYDQFYSSVLSYSLPNHWHIVAGAAPEAILNNTSAWAPGINVSKFLANDRAYLQEANGTPTIEDLLLGTGVSWKYYEFALGSYANAIKLQTNANHTAITVQGRAYDFWNPLAAKAESYEAAFASHYAVNTQFYADARNGTLPALSWVIPGGQDSDHPPANSTLAQGWLASLVDAVEASPEWNSTAIYVTWDDFGGFYDHVDPPAFMGQQLGFRVPLIEISPYTVAGSVSSGFGFFESILHLMEWRFNLGCLTFLDCHAPLPLQGYDFTAPPRAPMLFATNVSGATYPFSGPPAASPATLASYEPPAQYTLFPSGEAPDVD